jgi:hypothetical protein
MADLDYFLAGAGGGLRGLIEAYKMKAEREGEQAKIRQSGFNQLAVAKPPVDNTLALERLALAKKQADETARHNKVMEGKRAGGIPGALVNKLLGKDLFDPEAEVSPGERILGAQNVARENALAGARTQYQQIKDARDFLGAMQGDFDALSQKGMTGPLRGRFYGAISKATSGEKYPEIASYQRRKEGLVGRLKSVAGEVGRITDEDVKRMGVLIAGLESGTPAAKSTFAEINDILSRGQKNIETVYPGIHRQMGDLPAPSFAPGPTLPPAADVEDLLDAYGVPE